MRRGVLVAVAVGGAALERPLVDSRGFLRDVYPVLEYGEMEESRNVSRGAFRARTRCYMRGRQVPGDGACLFHALSAGLWLSMNGTHHPMDRKPLREQSLSLRQTAVDVLEDPRDPWLYMGDRERLRASKLLALAAEQCGQTEREYCAKLRKPYAWGGGPEIVALSNAMRRPIHVYELLWAVAEPDDDEEPLEADEEDDEAAARAHARRSPRWCLKCIAEFGSPRFDRKTPPLHILSCDSRFPNLSPEQMLDQGNHFLLLYDCEPEEAVDAARSAGANDEALRAVKALADKRHHRHAVYLNHLHSRVLDLQLYFKRKQTALAKVAASTALCLTPLALALALKRILPHSDDAPAVAPVSAFHAQPRRPPALAAALPRKIRPVGRFFF